MISTAFVLGAGLGTRLRPLTERRPKPLIPVCNKPLIAYAFDQLRAHGIERFVVNTHWRPECFVREFPKGTYRGSPITFRNEAPEVLETAGGMKNVEDLLGDAPFIVYNGDILCDLSLEDACHEHLANGHEVTLVLRSHGGPLQIEFDAERRAVTGIGPPTDPQAKPQFLFTGIYLVSPEFLRRIPPATKISVVPLFREMIESGAKLRGIVCDDGYWWDLGTRAQYLAVHRHFADRPEVAGRAPWVARGAKIASDVLLEGASAVGAGATIGAGSRLCDCLVWPGAEIASESDLTRCIITDASPVSGRHVDADL